MFPFKFFFSVFSVSAVSELEPNLDAVDEKLLTNKNWNLLQKGKDILAKFCSDSRKLNNKNLRGSFQVFSIDRHISTFTFGRDKDKTLHILLSTAATQ